MLKINDARIENDLRAHIQRCSAKLMSSEAIDAWVKARFDDSYQGLQKWESFSTIWRYYQLPPLDAQVLDLGCSSGATVFNAAQMGFQAWGVEPMSGMLDFGRRKHQHYLKTAQLPDADNPAFIQAVGENLPLADNSLDAIYTYQTLEHVQDVERVLQECVRVLKPGGLMYVCAPDYISFYEGHYCIFWLPLFPKKLSKPYLWLRGRTTSYIDSITYTTRRWLTRYLKNQGVLLYDHRLLGFYQLFEREIAAPQKIVSPFKRYVYQAAKFFKLQPALEFCEKWRWRLQNRWIHLVVIKKPASVPDKPVLNTIRTF